VPSLGRIIILCVVDFAWWSKLCSTEDARSWRKMVNNCQVLETWHILLCGAAASVTIACSHWR
jgi:hypothetical protein